ncbi:unnamed protein product [Orchesella dallaii]|uniref:Uncharacterized protein n=1 Tax=Orchesella dallaii TaxID=48710 RepID=A0ABP1PP44_9HEXA
MNSEAGCGMVAKLVLFSLFSVSCKKIRQNTHMRRTYIHHAHQPKGYQSNSEMYGSLQELWGLKHLIEKWLKYIHESKRNLEFPEEVERMQFCLWIMNDHSAVENHGDLLRTYVEEVHAILKNIPIPQEFFEKYTKTKSEHEPTNWPAKEQLRAFKTEEEGWGTGNSDNFFTRRDNSRTNGDIRQPTIHQGSRNTSIARGRGRGLSVAWNENTRYCLDRKGNRTIPWNHQTVKKEEDFDSPRNLAPAWLTGEADADEVEELTPAASKYTGRIKPEPLPSQNPSTFQRRPLQNNIGGGRARRDSDVIIVEERPVQLPPQDRKQNSQRLRQPSSTSSVTREQEKNHDNYEKLYERRSGKETRTPETSFSSQDVHIIDAADIIDYCDPNQKSRLEKEMENNGGISGQRSEVNSHIPLSASDSTGRMEVTNFLPQNRIQKAIQYFPNEAMGAEGGVYYNENDRSAPATSHPPPPPRQIQPASAYVQALQPSSNGRIPDRPPTQAQPGGSRGFIPPLETTKSLKKTGLLKSGRFVGPKSRAPPGPSNSTAPQENAPPPHRLPTSPLLPPAPRPPPCLSIRPRQDRDTSILRLDRSLPLNSQRKVRFAPSNTHEDIQRQVDETLSRFPVSEAPAIEKAPQNTISIAQQLRNQADQEGIFKLGRNHPTKRSGGIEAAVFNNDNLATAGPSNNPNSFNARARQDEQNPPKEREPEKEQQQPKKFLPEETNRKRKSRGTEDETSSENSPKRSSPPPPGSESSGSSSISEPSSSTSNPKNGEGATTSSPPSPPPPSPPPSPPPPQPALSPISVAENRTDDAIPSTSSTAAAPINSAAPPPPANSSDETSRSILLDIKPILHHSGEFEEEEIGQIISDPDTLREFASTIKSEFGRERIEYVPKKRMQQQEPEAPPPPPGYQEPGPSTARGRGRPRKTQPAASPPTPKRTGPVTRGQLKKKPSNFYKENVRKPTETTELIGKRYTQDNRSAMGSLDTLVHRGLGKIKLENDIHNPVVKEEEVEPEPIEMGSSEANSGSSSNYNEEEIIISSSDDEES